MIWLTGLNQKEFVLNSDLIEKIEEVPESMITLTNGKKYLVTESVEEIIKKVVKYKRGIYKFGI
jgi:flagellar protein FlbD